MNEHATSNEESLVPPERKWELAILYTNSQIQAVEALREQRESKKEGTADVDGTLERLGARLTLLKGESSDLNPEKVHGWAFQGLQEEKGRGGRK